MTLADRLLAAMAHANLTQAELARRCGVKPPSVSGWLSGKSKFLRGENLLSAARALGVNQQWLATGQGSMLSPEASSGVNAISVPSLSPAPLPGEAVIHIPLLANSASMGPGTDIEHDDVIMGALPISPEWLDKRIRPTSFDALRFIHAYGDSMSPTFEDGDILLVDTGRRDPSMADGVYVLGTSKRLFIKRVSERFDGTRVVSSDNKNVPLVQELNGDNEIDVLGRVVWVWNGRKL
ncbi:phage repressor protein C with HTH and peptisase S24 domain [Comamonas odontotermitis]|uniref:Phage repressor protein C with HTH and peptisase S24 domain n=1 Tax=Comamonas odontotermitis TaxID=379895 RepID=A0ABR6RKC1_9BURK|nr:helix-turn-helix transcriptional regulator [Comamonas odontotermitis]MBB6579625.1 phage repressor protein C with HTH and peptisase S24 domain [Comamonas odontotermitis]